MPIAWLHPQVQRSDSICVSPRARGSRDRNRKRHGQSPRVSFTSAGEDFYDVLSGGNFHGAPLALVFDYAAIALTDLASMSERRIERLVNPDLSEGLPPFLTAHPVLLGPDDRSGFRGITIE